VRRGGEGGGGGRNRYNRYLISLSLSKCLSQSVISHEF
jgi:hypothetical protein